MDFGRRKIVSLRELLNKDKGKCQSMKNQAISTEVNRRAEKANKIKYVPMPPRLTVTKQGRYRDLS